MSNPNMKPYNHETLSSDYRYAVVRIYRTKPDFSTTFGGGITTMLIAITEWAFHARDLANLLANANRGEEYGFVDAKGQLLGSTVVEPDPKPVDGWTTADTSTTSLETEIEADLAEIAAALEPEPFDGVPADTKQGSQIR